MLSIGGNDRSRRWSDGWSRWGRASYVKHHTASGFAPSVVPFPMPVEVQVEIEKDKATVVIRVWTVGTDRQVALVDF